MKGRWLAAVAVALLLSACGQEAVPAAAPSRPPASLAAQSTNGSRPPSASPATTSSAPAGSPGSRSGSARAANPGSGSRPAPAGTSGSGIGPAPAGSSGSGSGVQAEGSAAGAGLGLGRAAAVAAGANAGASAEAAAVEAARKVALAPNPAAKRIGPLRFISQTLNNCGPASVAEVLDFFGVQRTQAQVASVLRPALPAYGMSLFGVPFYAESVGMRTAGGVEGSQQLIKTFVANGIPVIVADLVSSQEPIRHFRPIDGYDDVAGSFIGSDPYLGPNHKISYADFDGLWKISFNRWVVIYPPAKQDLVDAIVSQTWNHAQAEQTTLQKAQQRANQDARQPWGWMELADAQIETGDFPNAALSIQKATQGGLPFEAHWLQLKLQRATGG